MAILENQLEVWSHQGAIKQSKDTYTAVKTALEDTKALYAGRSFEVFLQGSYGNDTNIYAESDVDVVIRLNSIFTKDLSKLSSNQQAAYQAAFETATYTFDEFKQGVITRLSKAFGAESVTPGPKAIHLKANGTRRSVDVLPCYQYRRYIRFFDLDDQEYVPGVTFPTPKGKIINYPKVHSENLTAKHQATKGWFKPMVRIMKNVRTHLVENGVISSDTAPSYYIEGMLYNVPKEKFAVSYAQTFYECMRWILDTDRSQFWCAHEQHSLLGNSQVQWPSANCDHFLNAVVDLWDNS